MLNDNSNSATPVLLLEYWKPVVGYEGRYEVSNIGNVCRIRDYNHLKAFKRLKQWPHWDGRLYVVIGSGKTRKTYKIHKMMVDAFLGGTPAGLTVNHENGDYTRNWLSNFSFMTDLENKRHAAAMGLMPHGSNHANAKITESQACEILALDGVMSYNEVSKKYGISTTAVGFIWQGRSWAHLGKDTPRRKGRRPAPKGEELPQAILTADIVKTIRSQKGKVDPKELAKQYGVSHWTIYNVWSGKNWKHVA